MAKKSAKKTVKLDNQGFIFPLAIGALALLFFTWYFLGMSKPQTTTMVENKIQSIDDLNAASKDLDSQNPDTFNVDLNSNSSDASNF